MANRLKKRGVVSFPKCGRTWLKLFFQYYFDFLGVKPVPIEFRHYHKAQYERQILLLRHPCDVIVSRYFQITLRKGMLNGISMSDFIRNEKFGLPDLNRKMKEWDESQAAGNSLVICYEDLFGPEAWVKIIKHLDLPFDREALTKAREMTKFETVRKNLATLKNAPNSLSYLAAEGNKQRVNPKNPESHKFRRGKVGGYVDYLSEADIKYIMDNFSFGDKLNFYREKYLNFNKS